MTDLLRNPDAEAALLGLYLTQPQAYARFGVAVEAFAEPRYRALYAAMQALVAQGDPIDPSLVAAIATRHGGSAADVFELADLAPPTLQSGVALVAAVGEALRRRAMHRAGRVLADLAVTRDLTPEESIAQHLESLRRATAVTMAPETCMPTVDVAGVQWLTGLIEPPVAARPALRTGFEAVDRLLHDLARGEVAVVAARPGIGKSAFGLQIAVANARRDHRVLLASAEMPQRQIVRRLYAMLADIPLAALRGREASGIELTTLDWARLTATTLPQRLRLFDRPAMTTQDIVDATMRLSVQEPLDLLVVDHLHHLADRGRERRHEQLAAMMLALKGIAMRHDCAVLVLAQLNREGHDVPTLHALREAGAIEEIASVVMLLHRPKPDLPEAEIHVAKNRDGEVGNIRLGWEGPFVRFAA